jgi:hypothetical protein
MNNIRRLSLDGFACTTVTPSPSSLASNDCERRKVCHPALRPRSTTEGLSPIRAQRLSSHRSILTSPVLNSRVVTIDKAGGRSSNGRDRSEEDARCFVIRRARSTSVASRSPTTRILNGTSFEFSIAGAVSLAFPFPFQSIDLVELTRLPSKVSPAFHFSSKSFATAL